MRKQSVTIRCDGDGCQTIADVETLADTPAGWYRVAKATEDMKTPGLQNGGWDFHSLRCVEKWAKARRVVVGDEPVSRYAQVVCPGCDSPIASQGFSAHWTSKHSELGERPTQAQLVRASS